VNIGISVRPASSVEIVIGDNRDNQIILLHATWEMFIERRANIEQLLQSPAPSSLAIQDLVIELVKIVVDPLMGATDFRDLVELGLESPRSPEEHTTRFYNNHFNYTL